MYDRALRVSIFRENDLDLLVTLILVDDNDEMVVLFCRSDHIGKPIVDDDAGSQDFALAQQADDTVVLSAHRPIIVHDINTIDGKETK